MVLLTGWTFDMIDAQPNWRTERLLRYAAARAQSKRAKEQDTTTPVEGGVVVRRQAER